MTDLILSKTETKLLLAAAEQEGGLLVPPETMKPSTRERMLGRFVRDGVALALEDGAGHQLTPAGYRASGCDRRGPSGPRPLPPRCRTTRLPQNLPPSRR